MAGDGNTAARRRRPGRTGPDLAAAALTLTVAAVVVLAAVGNLTDFGTNREFVRHVLAMDTTFRDPDLMWRAIDSPTVHTAVYVLIIGWECAAAAVLLLAVLHWARGLRRRDCARARALSTVGLVMVVLLFGLGFTAVGGEWFLMWQSADWNGLDAAHRNLMLAASALLTLHVRPVGPR
ncbi:DUF2165 domain-containing protein [Streptomyces sp. BR123]|uniref:DUF2165 domain-containing protein n=1 Tax=Streptomyces sp. BR123 TaxID=2749828 RepID=UPI0015C4D7AE|nr:DUF2165 domain-containing protein [Streptomyces sp. BR123]NXY95382.1 DUF2165 domain-containing protein [Streptomyces sp. BR123]